MEHFLQSAAAVLIAVIVILTLGKQGQDFAVLLTIGVCCMVILAAAAYLRPVMTFLEELQTMGSLNRETVGCVFKIVGIGLIAEIASLICTDAGQASLGKALQILSGAVILWLSIPVYRVLIDLIADILGGI